MKRSNKEETFELVQAINSAMKEGQLSEERLRRAFENNWENFEKILSKLPKLDSNAKPERPLEEMVSEILELVRKPSFELKSPVRNFSPKFNDTGKTIIRFKLDAKDMLEKKIPQAGLLGFVAKHFGLATEGVEGRFEANLEVVEMFAKLPGIYEKAYLEGKMHAFQNFLNTSIFDLEISYEF